MCEWQTVRIEDIAEKIAMRPFGSNIRTENFVSEGVPVIRGGNLTRGRFFGEGFVFLTEEKANELLSANAFPGDLVFTHRGTLGQVGLIPNHPFPRYVVSQSQMKLTCDKSKALPEFIYYFFKSPAGQNALLVNTSQTGVPAISRPVTSLKEIQLRLPAIEEQRAIAHILGTLDDKIELNRRQSETLQEMARALFKAWFVDFEPVRAKMSGRWQRGQTLPGLPAHLWNLFPNRLVETEHGEVPMGWTMRPVADFADIKGGKQLGKERIAETGQIPVFGGAGIMGYTEDYNAEGFVISVGRVGAYCGQFFRHRGKAWINNNASLIKQKEDYLGEWLFLALLHADIDVIKKGAAQPFVSNGDVAKLPLLWPQEQVIRQFSEIMVPLIRKQEGLEAEIKQLAALRDTLLPQLLSGALRVPDAETFLAARGLC